MQVLAKCQDLCLRDRTAANNLVRTCSSVDFQPGKRLSLPSGGGGVFGSGAGSGGSSSGGEYEESICYLSREQARPEGLGTLVNMPGHYLYSEVCLSCEITSFHSFLFKISMKLNYYSENVKFINKFQMIVECFVKYRKINKYNLKLIYILLIFKNY